VIARRSGGVGGFIIGAALGAGLALLLAPRSGRETRGEIRRRVRRVRRAAGQAASAVTDSVVGRFEDAKRRVEEQIAHARMGIDLRREQLRRAVDAGRAAADDARMELEQRISDSKAAMQVEVEVETMADRPLDA
jgi:gas vesicle protein